MTSYYTTKRTESSMIRDDTYPDMDLSHVPTIYKNTFLKESICSVDYTLTSAVSGT